MTYTPPKDWYGTATVSFTIHDMGFPSPSIGGSMSANTTLSVTVAAVNDAPTVTILSYPNVTEDTTLNIADLFVTDVDAYSGLLNVSVRTEKGMCREVWRILCMGRCWAGGCWPVLEGGVLGVLGCAGQ